MSQDLVQAGSNQRSFGQQEIDQSLGIVRELVVEGRLVGQYPLFGDLVVIVVIWQLACQKRIENDSQAPYIHFFARVFLSFEHLGCTIAYRPTECLEVASLPLIFARKPKIA